MDITFVITGKAGKSGHEQWRKVNDEDFSTRIYSHSKREASEASRLEIEIREFKGDVFTYYTYLIVKNVAQIKSKEDEEKHEKHGRTGSFFGMTIRIKGGYIPNVSRLYSIFENVFEQRIKGTILTDENTDGYLTFLIEKLSEGEDSFILAEKDILSAISTSDIIDLPTNCTTQHQKTGEIKTKLFNVGDTGHSSFLQALFNDAEVNVSRDYDTIEEIEVRRKQAEEQKKNNLEKTSISEQSSQNRPGNSDRHKGISSSSSSITRESALSQSKTNSLKSNTESSQYDNPGQTNDLYNRLLFKLVAIVFETCKVLLAFIARQKENDKSGITCNSEFQEYETKLHQISQELEEVKNNSGLMDKCQKGGRTNEHSFSLFSFPKFDYKLLIPIGIIGVILIGFFWGMHNSDDESNNKFEESVDSTKTEAKTKIDTTSVINEDSLPLKDQVLKLYQVKNSANLRPSPSTTESPICTLHQGDQFHVSKDTLNGTWVYGNTDDNKFGYISKRLLELVE